MAIFYIDNDYKCHTSNEEGLIEVESSFFDGKCNAFIEGYRYIPFGKSWKREDGVVFEGEMIVAWKDYAILQTVQSLYEQTNTAQEQADTDALLIDHEYRLTMLELGLFE